LTALCGEVYQRSLKEVHLAAAKLNISSYWN
jgi:hypothetical protein